MRIPIKVLKEIANKYNLSQVVMFAHHPENNDDHIVTYGKSLEDCSHAADFGNTIKDSLGWPIDLHAQPSRVKKLQKKVADLEWEIMQLKELHESPV